MSIDRDTFKNTSEDELADLSVPDQVLGYLAVNEDRAFKAREIASQIGADEGAVSTALSRLKDRDLVEHKATYWAITDDAERLDGYSGYERANRTVQQPTRGAEGQGRGASTPRGTTPECRGRAVTTKLYTDLRAWRRRLWEMTHSKVRRTLGLAHSLESRRPSVPRRPVYRTHVDLENLDGRPD